SASSGVPACHEPITRSPSAVRTKTVPSSSTRPHGSLAVPTANLLLGPGPGVTGSGLGDPDAPDDDLFLRVTVTGAVGVVRACLGHILDDSQPSREPAERGVTGRQRGGVAIHDEE